MLLIWCNIPTLPQRKFADDDPNLQNN